MLSLGIIKIPELVEDESFDSIYQCFSVGGNSNIPHTFHGFLSTKFSDDHEEIKNVLRNKLIKNSKYQLRKETMFIFSQIGMVSEFSLSGTQRYDYAVFFDVSKLFLFKIIHLDLIG